MSVVFNFYLLVLFLYQPNKPRKCCFCLISSFLPIPNFYCLMNFLNCWSSVGQKFSSLGPQLLSVGPGCDKKGIVMHELMHAVGFWHEQSRTDRNKFVEILWENVDKGEYCLVSLQLFPRCRSLFKNSLYDLTAEFDKMTY